MKVANINEIPSLGTTNEPLRYPSPSLVWVISETENDDFELSEVVVVAEELKLPDELSFLAQELKNRLKQQQYKIILDIFFIMLPLVLSDYGRHTGGTQRNRKTKNQRKSTKNSSKQERMTELDSCSPPCKQSAEGT